MSWIRSVPPDQAPPALAPIYERLRERSRGKPVSNVWSAAGLDPAGLEAMVSLDRALRDEPAPLSRVQVELIAEPLPTLLLDNMTGAMTERLGAGVPPIRSQGRTADMPSTAGR